MSEWFPTFSRVGQAVSSKELWRQLWQTPLLEIVRLQLSGRLDWKATIATTDLSEATRDKICDVVKSTRLWRLEKAQIADELIAHFQDGRQAGSCEETLLANFGDTKTVAKLMRASKKRNRSLFWKALAGVGYMLATLLAAYSIAAIWFIVGKPNPSVDYLYAANEPARDVPVEEQAWLVYRDAWIEHDFYELSMHQGMKPLVQQSKDGRQRALVGPRDKEWRQVIQFLDEHKTLVDAFRVGGQRTGFGLELAHQFDYSDEDFKALNGLRSWEGKDELRMPSKDEETLLDKSLISILLPHTQMMRDVSAVLRADMLRAAEEGHAELVVEDVTAMLGLGPQVAEHPFLVCALVSFAVERVAFDAIEELITTYPQLLNPRQIERMLLQVESLPIRSFASQEGEQLFRKDVIQRIYSDDGNGDGRITDEGMAALSQLSGLTGSVSDPQFISLSRLAGPAAMLASASRKEVEQVLDEFVDRVESDFSQPIFRKPLDAFGTEEATLKKCGAMDVVTVKLLKMLLPDTDGIRIAVERCDARRGAVLIALAAKRYELEHGQWPISIDELVPGFLKEIPPDPVTGKPLKYAVLKGEPVIYSVGFDRDDDGGDKVVADSPIVEQAWPAWIADLADAPDGDWILWPMSR